MKTSTDTIVALLFATARLIRQEKRPDASSMWRVRTLHFVAEQKNPTMKSVADFLGITPPSATAIISTFVREKQLARTIDKRDRRIVRLSLTPLGRKALESGKKKVAAHLKSVISRLDDKERMQLINILKKLRAAYEK